MADNLCIGVDVGGTNLRFGVFQGAECLRCTRREVDLRQRCEAASDSAAAREIVLTALAEGIHELLSDFPEVARVGLAFPGFVDHDGVLL
ncbi:MAG: ROK family protein, partial [Acidithiobacillus sp.]